MKSSYSSKGEKFKFDIKKFTKPIDGYFKKWADEVKEDIENQETDVKKFIEYFLPKEGEKPQNIEIHIAGKGRSGIVGKYASVRFVNGSYTVYNEFDELTPPIGRKEKGKRYILYALSGGGETVPVVDAAKVAKDKNVPVLVITSTDPSSLAELADVKIVTRSRTKEFIENEEEKIGLIEPIGYLGSESEFKALIASELLVNHLYKRMEITEKDAKEGHKQEEV